jgi:hypothetical protein
MDGLIKTRLSNFKATIKDVEREFLTEEEIQTCGIKRFACW